MTTSGRRSSHESTGHETSTEALDAKTEESPPTASTPVHEGGTIAAWADRIVDAEGHRLTIAVTGATGPPVVMLSGLGGRHLPWWQVCGLLADVLCVSFGRSQSGHHALTPSLDEPEPRTASWATDQLRRLLRTADIRPPYVLVGVSTGGWITDRFAAAWPDEIAGLVQLDPTATTPLADVTDDRGRSAAARAEGDADGVGITFDWGASRAELHARPPSPPPRAVVISRASRTPPFGTSERTWRPLAASELDLAWLGCQAEWAHRLRATHVIATRGGHYLYKSAPELVAAVIRQVIRAVRRDTDLVLDPSHLALVDGILSRDGHAESRPVGDEAVGARR